MPDTNDDILQVSMEDIMSGAAVRPDILTDLFAISKVPSDKAEAIAKQLRSLTGLNDADSIREAIKRVLRESEENSASAVWRALVNLDAKEIPNLLATLGKWVAKDQPRSKVFTEELFSNLESNLDVLIADFPAIEMMQKANKLVKDTSGELQDLKYICDLRPVYNDERTDVDAFVLVANLRMIYLEQNNERSVCEIALTEEELLMVKEETEKALAKMKVLKQVGASLDSKSAGDVK